MNQKVVLTLFLSSLIATCVLSYLKLGNRECLVLASFALAIFSLWFQIISNIPFVVKLANVLVTFFSWQYASILAFNGLSNTPNMDVTVITSYALAIVITLFFSAMFTHFFKQN